MDDRQLLIEKITKSLVEAISEKCTDRGEISLKEAKILAESIEQKAAERGLCAAVAVVGKSGNPVLVHVMRDSLLVSFDAAIKKAYTAVAVKMPTDKLSQLSKQGQMFYGVESIQPGKLVTIAGGVPLIRNGKLIGGLGISGGTDIEDKQLALYGLEVFELGL